MNELRYSNSILASSVVNCNLKARDVFFHFGYKCEGESTQSDITNMSVIKQNDNARQLPKYSSILEKSGDDGISMDDLDQIQHDLEKLLSTSAVRIRYLLSEIDEIERIGEIHDRKVHNKISLKRKRTDEKPKFKDVKNGMKVVKKHYGLPVNKFVGDNNLYQEIPRVSLPRNDNSDKFWTSIEPFCANITKNDIAFLDNFSEEIDIKIPGIGEHFANAWSEEVIGDEQNLGKLPSKKSPNFDVKKNGLYTMVETFAAPQTQRLLALLIEERVLNVIPKNGENCIKSTKLQTSDLLKLKPNISGQKLGTCLNHRLKKELTEQGLLSIEDLTKSGENEYDKTISKVLIKIIIYKQTG